MTSQQSEIETLGRLERRLTMALPADQIEREVEQRLKRLSRTVRMDGFRPGHVPFKIVARQYGPQVRSEVTADAVQKAFAEAVRAQNLKVAGYPRIERKPSDDEGKSLTFSATFEIYPEVQLGDLSAVKIERPVHPVEDADVERTIEILRRQRIIWEGVERPAQSGDRVTVDFLGRIDGEEFPGGRGHGTEVVLGEGKMLPEFETNLAGIRAGETRSFDLVYPADYSVKTLAGKTARFEVTARKVETPKLPEVDEDFARALGVADGDVAKMRAEVRANVEREAKKRIEEILKQRVMQALLDSTQPELPRSLVEIEMQRLIEQAHAELHNRGIRMERLPINPEAVEQQARRRVALGLIIGELVRAHDLAAKPEQVKALVTEYAQTYENPLEVVKWVYSERERLREFEGLAVEANIVKWVLSQARVEDKAVSFDELMGAAA